MIRNLEGSDVDAVRKIHAASGLDYALPDLAHPLFVNKLVSEAEGRIIAAGLHRICYETFVLVNPAVQPGQKWTALRELNAALSDRAYWQGLDMTHASVPSIGFDKRLRQLGWSPDREGWRLWSRETHAIGR